MEARVDLPAPGMPQTSTTSMGRELLSIAAEGDVRLLLETGGYHLSIGVFEIEE